jgi:hypothetical protein
VCFSKQKLSKIWLKPVLALAAPYSSNKNKLRKNLEVHCADNLEIAREHWNQNERKYKKLIM